VFQINQSMIEHLRIRLIYRNNELEDFWDCRDLTVNNTVSVTFFDKNGSFHIVPFFSLYAFKITAYTEEEYLNKMGKVA